LKSKEPQKRPESYMRRVIDMVQVAPAIRH
jgi:hypothetical protein